MVDVWILLSMRSKLFMVIIEIQNEEKKIERLIINKGWKYKRTIRLIFKIGVCRTPMWSICLFVFHAKIQYFANIFKPVLRILCKFQVSLVWVPISPYLNLLWCAVTVPWGFAEGSTKVLWGLLRSYNGSVVVLSVFMRFHKIFGTILSWK